MHILDKSANPSPIRQSDASPRPIYQSNTNSEIQNQPNANLPIQRQHSTYSEIEHQSVANPQTNANTSIQSQSPNPLPIQQSSTNRPIRCQSIAITPIRTPHGPCLPMHQTRPSAPNNRNRTFTDWRRIGTNHANRRSFRDIPVE